MAVQVEKLLEAYEEMAVELPEATELKARHHQALAWTEEAQKHLSTTETPTKEHTPILEVSCLKSLSYIVVLRAFAARQLCAIDA